jgi:hypothetical protein
MKWSEGFSLLSLATSGHDYARYVNGSSRRVCTGYSTTPTQL